MERVETLFLNSLKNEVHFQKHYICTHRGWVISCLTKKQQPPMPHLPRLEKLTVKGATNSKAVMITLGNCNKLASTTAYADNVAHSIPAEHVAANYLKIVEISQCMCLSSSGVYGFVLYTSYGL
jgi:hypothetical protein